MILEVSHRTTYRYEHPVVLSRHRVHMTPRGSANQVVLRHSLLVEPAPTYRLDAVDVFANPVTTLEIESPHDELVLHARCAVAVTPPAAFDATATIAWDRLADRLSGDAPLAGALDVRQLRCATPLTTAPPALVDYVATSFPAGRPVLDGAFDLTRRIYREFRFDPAATDVSTPIATVLQTRRGVCQDFAHLAIAGLRAIGVPARYISGYVLTKPPPGQAKLQGADASHAWLAVWAPETGWVGFDPTNGRLSGDDYVTTAWGRDYNDVSPITGVLLGGGAHTVVAAVDVTTPFEGDAD